MPTLARPLTMAFSDYAKIASILEFFDQLPALAIAVQIENHAGNVFYVRVDGVTEQQKLDERDG